VQPRSRSDLLADTDDLAVGVQSPSPLDLG